MEKYKYLKTDFGNCETIDKRKACEIRDYFIGKQGGFPNRNYTVCIRSKVANFRTHVTYDCCLRKDHQEFDADDFHYENTLTYRGLWLPNCCNIQ